MFCGETIEVFRPFFGFLGQLAHETEGSLRVEVLTMAASGDHVLVFERVTGERQGRCSTPRRRWFSSWTAAL